MGLEIQYGAPDLLSLCRPHLRRPLCLSTHPDCASARLNLSELGHNAGDYTEVPDSKLCSADPCPPAALGTSRGFCETYDSKEACQQVALRQSAVRPQQPLSPPAFAHHARTLLTALHGRYGCDTQAALLIDSL